MTKMKVLNKNGNILSLGDYLSFCMEIRTDGEIKDVCFRCMVYYNDDTPVCMASTRQGDISLSKSGGELKMELNSSHLAPGKYHLKLALYHVNSFGTEELLDVLDKAFYFEIDNNNAVNGLIWLPQYWGHMSADLKVINGNR